MSRERPGPPGSQTETPPGEPAQPPSAPGTTTHPPRRRRRIWIVLGALTCCCGAPFVWLPFTMIGGKQVTGLHARLKPGMSVADVLRQVDEVSLWSLGLSHISASGDSCPVAASLAWSSNRSPWNGGASQTLEDAARRLAGCDRITFRLVVPNTRFHFVVTLKDGRVSGVSPVEGQFE